MILMAVKFFTVVYIFMHLRFDKPILSWIFWAGLVLAVGVYLAAMCTFRIFWPESHG
jgi:cytochrome c oxidase subunit 4